MDYNQQNSDGDNSTVTFKQPQNSLHLTLSTTSTLDSTSKKTNSLMISKQSNLNIDYAINRIKSLRKRYYQQQKQIEHCTSSHSTNTRSTLPSTTTIMKKTEKQQKSLKNFSKIQTQEARPLGICLRKCIQCRQFKHILLAECTVCYRMMDIDLKDCKCQIVTNKNIIDHFICSICNSELTLDEYIICANRTCQTTLSTLINKESMNEIEEKSVLSTILTNIYYPKSTHRTVAIQANTLINLPSVQKFLPTIIDDENEKSSSSMSWSKHDSDWTIITSPDSSDISSMSIDSNINVSLDNITRNVTAAFNSNQPTKLTLQSEDKLRQHQSQLTNTNDKIINNNLEFIEMPKSPRCLPIMNVHSRHDRLSTLLKLKKNEICQTQLSCLMDIDEMIRCDELVDPIVIRTNNLTHIERQIQVDTIRGRFHGLCQTRIEIDDRIEKDSTINLTNDDRILQALIDRDGQRWSELIDQLINEQSNFSLSDIAQQLLDTIERLYTTERLNNLTTGQLQRKVRYAMSQLKHIDENSYLRNNFKTTKTNHTNINSRKQTECNGTMDMAVTVRQIDKHQTTASPDHIWKSYVDRLFDQGHSANEIQRLLHKAAEKTMQCDDYRLQDVFNYINTKTKQQRAKTAPSKIAFIASSPKTIPVTSEQSQSTNLFQSIKFNKTLDNSSKIMICPSTSISARKEMSNELSSTFINKDQRSTTERTKNKSSSSNTSLNTNLIKSSSIEPNIIQIESTENKFITDLNKNEKERNLSLHSSIDHEHVNIMVKSSLATMNKQQSIANRETIIPSEKNDNLDSDKIVIINEQKSSQIQKIIDSSTSQTNRASSLYNLKSSSTTRITSVTDMPLTNFEEKSIDALHHVENTHLHEHSLNIPFELNKLIDIIFESNLRKPDNIEILMTKCIELLTNEEQIIVPQLEEVHSQHMNEAISNTLNLLQEYKKLTMPFIINYEDLSYNRHISNMIKISSDSQISLKLVNENMEQTIESSSQPIQSDIDLDLKKQVNTSEYQETVSSIEYRPMSYTVSNEKGSTESSRQDFICSTNHISLKTKELDEELVTNKNDLNNISDIPLKIESELYDDLSLKQWLDALLSKLSDNISRTSIIDQTKINVKDKQESIIMKPVDEHVSSLNEQRSKSSISIKERTTNMIETTDDKHNIQYVTDVIMLKKEYAMSIIIPDQIFSMIDEHFQLVETKLLQTKVATDSKQILKSNDQLLSSVNEENIEHVNKELSNFNYDFDDKFQTSSFATLLHANHVDEEKQSISFVVNDETPSITGRSSAPSDIDLSEQLNQLQIHEWSVSPKQLVPSDLSESKEKFESSQKILPMFESEDIVLSKTDMNFVPEINTESSPSNDQEEEKEKTKSILSFSSEDNEHESLIETNEPHIDIITSSKSSHINKQVFDEHTSITASIVFNHQNEISKLQLPVSTKYFSTSNDIQSNSFLIHLNHQTSTIPHKKSISNHTPMLNEEKNSPINSHDQNLVIETSIQNSEDKKLSSEKIDNVTTNHFHESTILSLNHNITPQSVKSILYPSKTTKIEHIKYDKITTSLPPSLEPATIPITRMFDYRHEIENEKLSSQLEERATDNNTHQSDLKQQSSVTNRMIRNGTPSSSMPKLLLKRSSIKQNSATSQIKKPNAASSITDISTSSSNTGTIDHLQSTHSIISDQEEVISLKTTNKTKNSNNEFISKVDSTSKHIILRKKTPQSSQNQSLISLNRKQHNIEISKKKFTNNSLLTNSELAYDTEQGSDVWMNSHEDITQSINDQNEKKSKIHKRQQKKQNKNRIIDGSKFMPLNLKARSDHQAHTVDSSRLPSIEQSCGERDLKKLSNDLSRRPIIRLPITQIEKFECGTIGPHLHPSSIARQLFYLPSIHNRHHLSSQIYETTESLTDQFYSFMSSKNIDDKQAFESILNWQQQQSQHPISKTEQSKCQQVYLLDTSTSNTIRGRQYPILTDEIDMIDDPNACTIVNKWAFADLVNAEREKFIQESRNKITKSKKRSHLNNNIKICLRKRPLTQFEQDVFKEVDIISIVDSQTIFLHIPSITIDNQVFIKNRKFKCDQTFDEHCQISTIYHSTLAPLLDLTIDGSNCLCLIGGGKYSGKNYLLHSLIDLFAFDLIRLLSSYDIYIKLLGICHNRMIDLLQNYSPIRIIKSMDWTLIPNDVFHLKNDNDIDYITCQIKKRRRFIHQLIQINFHEKEQSIMIGSLMIVVLASSQYVYTKDLCSHRKKFLINSLNKTILSFKRALLGIRQNPDRVRAAFNNDILTRLIEPYVFHDQSNICYIGTLNPGHRHRIATKSTIEFARNLRFCLKRINKQRRKRKELSRINTNNNDNTF